MSNLGVEGHRPRSVCTTMGPDHVNNIIGGIDARGGGGSQISILLLEWSTTSQRLWVYRISVPYAQKHPRFLFEKRRGQPLEFWSHVSTIDGNTLPQDCVEEQLC